MKDKTKTKTNQTTNSNKNATKKTNKKQKAQKNKIGIVYLLNFQKILLKNTKKKETFENTEEKKNYWCKSVS